MHCVIGDTSNPTDVTPLTTDVTPLPPTDGKVYLCADDVISIATHLLKFELE